MPASRPQSRRVVVLADREADALSVSDRRLLAAAAAASQVLIVAPAGPVSGERWVIDLAVRRARAQERLEAWAALLAPHARRVRSEVGDATPRCALADACGQFGPDRIVALEPHVSLASGRWAWLEWLLDRLTAAEARAAPDRGVTVLRPRVRTRRARRPLTGVRAARGRSRAARG